MVGWPPHLHTQGSFPSPLLCSSSRFTSNFLKATFLTDLQTEPYVELQISSQTFASGRQNPETHIFCRKYERDPRSFWQNHSLLLLGALFFSIKVVGENVSIIVSYFSPLMCFISFSNQSKSQLLFQGISRIKFTWPPPMLYKPLLLSLCYWLFLIIGSCCHLWHSY